MDKPSTTLHNMMINGVVERTVNIFEIPSDNSTSYAWVWAQRRGWYCCLNARDDYYGPYKTEEEALVMCKLLTL